MPELNEQPRAPEAGPVFGPTNPKGLRDDDGIIRFAQAVELLPEREAVYRRLHAQVFPTVLRTLATVGIRNYHIFVGDVAGTRLLWSFFEFVGDDWEEASALIQGCADTRHWWELTGPCQRRLAGTPPGQQWLPLERVFGWLGANAQSEGL